MPTKIQPLGWIFLCAMHQWHAKCPVLHSAHACGRLGQRLRGGGYPFMGSNNQAVGAAYITITITIRAANPLNAQA